MFRIGRIINFINTSSDIKVFLNLMKLLYFLILYVHLVGCFWFFICRMDDSWLPPLDYMFVKTDIYESSS